MRRVRRRGVNKEKVFGCDLLEHLTASCQEIPHVLRCCSEFVEQHGIVDGIYRLSGVSSNIQKLRGEFENDATPDLNKDVYLQDIHCISSLCKAYFRELPNPLLTYQLYDKFAEAVAIQLEEERLVKIRDVLKELPKPHYRTLEYLMQHLVRMASYSSETNMHARNLAIVWAPNLLRSKDIEASGFNGTAAFMEVRVQSIVVEFILTHVPQLFPEQGVSNERRNSLPSTSVLSSPGEGILKCVPTQPLAHIGNISPGDGPLPIRPYHAIIEGTDKRKGSLKGKKWMSIFNIGGRFPDPRRKNKHLAKEKERPALRPARSMDSLSTPSYPNDGSRRPSQRPPSTSMSPLVTASAKSGMDVTVSAGAIGGSEYAVTYRRGTGLVSGGAGTQGTYTALDPEGLGIAGNESLQSRSPGLSTKAGRRAAMHITGPTLVTVPLHITSNLALGVLQGGGSDRVVHRGRDKDGGERGEGKDGREKVDRKESDETERKVEEDKKAEEKGKHPRRKDRGGVVDIEGTTFVARGGGEEKDEGAKEEEKEEEEVIKDCRQKPELVMRSLSREQRIKSLNSSTNDDPDDNDGYMDMKELEPAVPQHGEDCVFDASDVLNSTEAEGDDHELSGYVQDNFEFLDQMDCSALDHMESTSYQMNEFSVEPPGHSYDEYELMAQYPAELQTHLTPGPETHPQSQDELNPHRPLSLDLQNRHTKSLSLPYMTSPVDGPEEPSSEDEDPEDISDDEDYSSEDESMFCKSLPPDIFLNMTGLELDTDPQESCTPDRLPVDQLKSSEEREAETLNMEEPAAGEQLQGEVKGEDGLEEKQIMKEEEEEEEESALDKDGDQPEKHTQSRTAEEELSVTEDTQSDKEESPTSDVPAQCCAAFPLPTDEDNEEKEVADNSLSDYPPHSTDSSAAQEIGDVFLEESRDFSVKERDSDEGYDRRECKETEATSEEMVLEVKENHTNMCEESTEEGGEVITDKIHEEKMQEDDKEQDRAVCQAGSGIWDELEDVICEMIEDEESEQAEREGVAQQQDVGEEDLEDILTSEVEEDGPNKTDGKTEVEKDLMETTDEKLTDPEMQQEFVEQESCLSKISDIEKAVEETHAFSDGAQHRNIEEVVSKEPEKENNDQDKADERLRTLENIQEQMKVKPDRKRLQEGRKCEESDISQGGVGRMLVVSKSPKFYQAKAVPVVPPKPQHCKITALTLRQQQQQRERRDAENMLKVLTEQDKVCAGHGGERERERERERRRDGDEGATKDTNRNSPVSMCFDEAVAIATMRREKEKVCEKEKERQREWGSEVQ